MQANGLSSINPNLQNVEGKDYDPSQPWAGSLTIRRHTPLRRIRRCETYPLDCSNQAIDAQLPIPFLDQQLVATDFVKHGVVGIVKA